jgi:hypothetical protein
MLKSQSKRSKCFDDLNQKKRSTEKRQKNKKRKPKLHKKDFKQLHKIQIKNIKLVKKFKDPYGLSIKLSKIREMNATSAISKLNLNTIPTA